MKRYKLTEVVINDQVLPVEVLIHPHSKRLRLRFGRDFKSILITLPQFSLKKEAFRFLEQSKSWIEANYQKKSFLIRLEPGQKIPYNNKEVWLDFKPHTRSSVWEEPGKIIVFGTLDRFEKILLQYLKRKIREILEERVNHYSKNLGVSYNRLFIRDSRTNWGSCSHKKNLSFSWRLIFAPKEVIDYLAIHEVAHLIEMNHSKNFWAIVRTLSANYETHRSWLRKEGKSIL